MHSTTTPGAEKLTLTVYDNPAVIWIWIGGALLILGGILYAIPRRRRLSVESPEVDDMTPDEDDLSQLLDAAIIAARQPEGSPPPSDAVAGLLAKAEDLSRGPGEAEADPDDVVAFLEQARQRLGSGGSAAARPAPSARAGTPAAATPSAARRQRPTGLLVAGAIVVVAAIVVGAFLFGKSAGSDIPGFTGPATNVSPSASASATTQAVDPAKVAALMEKIAADPKDAKSLLALGDLYYTAADYANASTFYEKAAAIDPKNEEAQIAIAASAYNAGDDEKAFKAWNVVLALNPDNIEAHYGLGFYYLSRTPADEAKAKAEWQKVVEIDPKSPLATTVQSHLDSLAASPIATPSAS